MSLISMVESTEIAYILLNFLCICRLGWQQTTTGSDTRIPPLNGLDGIGRNTYLLSFIECVCACAYLLLVDLKADHVRMVEFGSWSNINFDTHTHAHTHTHTHTYTHTHTHTHMHTHTHTHTHKHLTPLFLLVHYYRWKCTIGHTSIKTSSNTCIHLSLLNVPF